MSGVLTDEAICTHRLDLSDEAGFRETQDEVLDGRGVC
jgi:hypothetical protein